MKTLRESAPEQAPPAAGQIGTSWPGVAMAVTLSRLPLAVILYLLIPRSQVGATLALLLFVVLDVADGTIARALGQESPVRRAADGVIDRAASLACLVAGAGLSDATFVQIAVALILSREMIASTKNFRLLVRYGTVFKATSVHKASSLGYAGAGLAMLWLNDFGASSAAIVAALISWGLAVPYFKEQRLAEAKTHPRTSPSNARSRGARSLGQAAA